ncbi:MFS transporter [Acidisoma cellulosilytica]|uniref:MFS transporter n=1 Tax=Acidisoma cellulosilyticum TaxID=2802395 RepID=A0A963Z1K6_9PROT|nr:MFS transporter [Acidisoma cellulosilyticum]MCB8880971.1 MFS transporter [Acidisoma cellulosilyticum]
MIRSLLTGRRFAPLFWCQFFAAFNDNFLKNALLFLILWGAIGAGIHGGEPPHAANVLITLAGAIFILPFFLLSAIGGEMADRYDKALLCQRIKLVEIAVAVLAVLGFLVQSVPILFIALFAFGTLSALFGPVKYGILPDHLPSEALPTANALVEGATFLAIIGGTAAGGFASALPHGRLILAGTVLIFAVLSWLAARQIPPTGESAPSLSIQRNIFASTFSLVRDLKGDRRIWWVALANSWFWLVGAIALGLLPGLIKQSLGGDRETATLALLLFCFGIAAGSLLAARLTGGRVKLMPSVIGTALVGIFMLDLWRVTHSAAGQRDLTTHVFIDLLLISISGGLLAVPTFAALQAWAKPDHRARIVAGANVVGAGAMAIGAILTAALLGAGLGVSLIYGLLGIACLTVAAWMMATQPKQQNHGEATMDMTIFEATAQAARKHGRNSLAAEDATSGSITYKRLLLGAAILGRKLAPLSAAREAVGVLMPNANATMALVLGLVSSGRVPTMLNFTAGAANLLHACRAAKVRTIITSRVFIQKGELEKLIEGLEASPDGERLRIVYLEDIRKQITTVDKLRGILQASRPMAKGRADDTAAIVFTSGSEGVPKGVAISHRNMLANIAQVAARIDFDTSDRIFNVLPMFHSFGLTAGLVLPLFYGLRVFQYPSPLHYKTIPELIRKSGATALIGTDTFLAGYGRQAKPDDFRTLRYVVAGAEPVKAATRALYQEKFGIALLEGYGVTETGPVLALNTPAFSRIGTVGQMLPGIELRLDPVPGIAEGGRLVVRGPNIMLGYLRVDAPGMIEPLVEGWHDTGDIVTIDAEGFITIKGRAKRFAKLGGEMISLQAIDLLAAELWPDAVSVAAAIPDARKGEKVILFTEQTDAERGRFLAFARAQGATELMVPAEIRVIPAVPILGSGKVDFAGVQRLALSSVASGQAA